MELGEVAPPPMAGGGLVRVSSLRVRNAVLHDLTAAADDNDDDDAAIRLSTATIHGCVDSGCVIDSTQTVKKRGGELPTRYHCSST